LIFFASSEVIVVGVVHGNLDLLSHLRDIDTNLSALGDEAYPDSDKIQRTADLDGEGTAFAEGEADILGRKARDRGNDLDLRGQCNHLRIRNLAFVVGAVETGGRRVIARLRCHR